MALKKVKKIVDEENIEYASGLQDFIEGNYYFNRKEAELEFYNQQQTLCWSNMEQKKRWYEDSLKRYEQVKLLVKNIKESLKESIEIDE